MTTRSNNTIPWISRPTWDTAWDVTMQLRSNEPRVTVVGDVIRVAANIDSSTRVVLYGPRDWIIRCTYTDECVDVSATEVFACGLHYSVTRRTASPVRHCQFITACPEAAWFTALDRSITDMCLSPRYAHNGHHEALYKDNIFIGLHTRTFEMRLSDLALIALQCRCTSQIDDLDAIITTSLDKLIDGYWFKWKACNGSRLLSRIESLIRCDN